MPTGFDVPSGGNLPERLIPVAHRLADYLQRARAAGSITPANPKTAADLVAGIGANVKGVKVDGPSIRAMVNFLRVHKTPIASTGNGYFWANTTKELNQTILHMMERISAIQAAIAGLERSIPPTGQRELL